MKNKKEIKNKNNSKIKNKNKNKKIYIIINFIILILITTNIQAHGGNITGWKDKYSKEITKYEDKYYGHHKEDGKTHYHEVKWNEEKQKWEIINPAVYYDENFKIIDEINGENGNKAKNEKTIKKEIKYSRSVDGDTAKFILNDKEITVRFLGINTPETVDKNRPEEPFGKEASNFTKEKLENAKKIEIEYDENAQKQDKYNRELAWIWVDDNLLQEEIILKGLAKTYMLPNTYKYAAKLQLAESKAKEENLGVWSLKQNEIKTENKKENEKNEISIEVKIAILLVAATLLIIFGKSTKDNIKKMKKLNKKLNKK